MYDHVHYIGYDLDKKKIVTSSNVCFGFLNSYQRENLKYLEFYFMSFLSLQELNLYLFYLKEENLFRNAEVTVWKKKLRGYPFNQRPHNHMVGWEEADKNYFSFTVNVDTITKQEIFLIGLLVRIASYDPTLGQRILKIKSLCPYYTMFNCIFLGYGVSFEGKGGDGTEFGHTLIPYCFNKIKIKSIEEIQKHIDKERKKYLTFKLSRFYGFIDGFNNMVVSYSYNMRKKDFNMDEVRKLF